MMRHNMTTANRLWPLLATILLALFFWLFGGLTVATAADSPDDAAAATVATMPNLRGMNYADALAALERVGLTDVHVVKYTDQGDVEFNPFGVLNPRNWTVVSQSIDPGTPLTPAAGSDSAQTDAEKPLDAPDAIAPADAAESDAAALKPPRLTLSLVRCAIGIQGFDFAEVFSHLPF